MISKKTVVLFFGTLKREANESINKNVRDSKAERQM